jgi:hypothetical protein
MDDWRVMIEVETDSPSGRRSLKLELPRGDFNLEELHDVARSGAEAASVLSEETTAVGVWVSFPDGHDAGLRAMEAVLLARLQTWYRCARVVLRPRS